MNKITSIIGSLIRQTSRILFTGIIVNATRFFFLLIIGTSHNPRFIIAIGILLCFLFPILYLILLKIRFIPMIAHALFMTFKGNLDELSSNLTHHLIILHGRVDQQRDTVPTKTKRVLEKVSSHILRIDSKVITESLENDNPEEQFTQLQSSVYESLQSYTASSR